MLASCDVEHSDTLVDVGAMERWSDGGIFGDSEFGVALESRALPLLRQINDRNSFDFPFVFVGDEAFSLTHHMIRPYQKNWLNREKRVYNYRLSRDRRTIENTFGIMCMKWRIYQRSIHKADFTRTFFWQWSRMALLSLIFSWLQVFNP